MPLLEVKNLRVRFTTRHGVLRAVDGISFTLEPGETLGLVGESGSGKSVTNLALIGMLPAPPATVEADAVRFAGRDLLRASAAELRALRGREISMIFQDPMTSLHPLLTVGRQLTEVLETHLGTPRQEARTICARALGDVGIPNPEARLASYPHEMSGGMRQRVMIAMALLCKPKVLLADEPTTALDVTIQAQILELLKDLRERHDTAMILVTHDLGVVAGAADRVLVMYAGRVAESGETRELFANPRHPYTRGLLQSIPTIEGEVAESLFSIPGQPPDLTSPAGTAAAGAAPLLQSCAFQPRCAHAIARCEVEQPVLEAQERAGVAGAGTSGKRAADEPHSVDEPHRAACFVARSL